MDKRGHLGALLTLMLPTCCTSRLSLPGGRWGREEIAIHSPVRLLEAGVKSTMLGTLSKCLMNEC